MKNKIKKEKIVKHYSEDYLNKTKKERDKEIIETIKEILKTKHCLIIAVGSNTELSKVDELTHMITMNYTESISKQELVAVTMGVVQTILQESERPTTKKTEETEK